MSCSLLCVLQRDSHSRIRSAIVLLESTASLRIRQWNIHGLLDIPQLFDLLNEGLILLLAVGADNHLLFCVLFLGWPTLLASRGSTGFGLAGGAPVLQVLVLMRDVLLILFQFEHVLHLELLEVLLNVLHLVKVVVINIDDLLRDVIDLVNVGGVILVQKPSLLDPAMGIASRFGGYGKVLLFVLNHIDVLDDEDFSVPLDVS